MQRIRTSCRAFAAPPRTHVGALSSPSRPAVGAWGGDSAATHPSFPLPASPPYELPLSALFRAERGGAFDRRWLTHHLPRAAASIRAARHLPSRDALWAMPPHAALAHMAHHRPYASTLRTIMEHGYFFLLDELLLHAEDAPLPHVLYDDVMRCMTFASAQAPPEFQFALPPHQLQRLLCLAAYHCTLDAHYFPTVRALYARIAQQQHRGAAVRSAWVYVCTAAGEEARGLRCARAMAQDGVAFDAEVFALMQHPSVHPRLMARGAVPHVMSSMLVQRRLGAALPGGAAAVALHAMLVYTALTLRPARVWAVLRWALEEERVVPAERTVGWAMGLFARQKGVRCGARTVAALVRFFVFGSAGETDRTGRVYHEEGASSAAARVVYILMRVRRNERVVPAWAALPPVAWDEEECAAMVAMARERGRGDARWGVALPVLRRLLPAGGGRGHRRSPAAVIERQDSPQSRSHRDRFVHDSGRRQVEAWGDAERSLVAQTAAPGAHRDGAEQEEEQEDCLSVIDVVARAVQALDRPAASSPRYWFGIRTDDAVHSAEETDARGGGGAGGGRDHGSHSGDEPEMRHCEREVDPSSAPVSSLALRDFLQQLRELDTISKLPVTHVTQPAEQDDDDDDETRCLGDGQGAEDDAAERRATYPTPRQREAVQTCTSLRHFAARVRRDTAHDARLARQAPTAWMELS